MRQTAPAANKQTYWDPGLFVITGIPVCLQTGAGLLGSRFVCKYVVESLGTRLVCNYYDPRVLAIGSGITWLRLLGSQFTSRNPNPGHLHHNMR